MEFAEYPKALRGPDGGIAIVQDAAGEAALKEADYRDTGPSSAAAFAKAQARRPEPALAYQEWPKFVNGEIVNDPAEPPVAPVGEFPKFVAGRLIESREDELALLDEGAPPPGRSGERAELMRLAGELGCKPRVTWGTTRLREAVSEAQKRRFLYPMALRNTEGEVKIVRDAAEEKAAVEQGYEAAAQYDPAAVAKAKEQPAGAYQEWPKFIDGKIVDDPAAPPPYPKFVNGRRVENKEDELAVLAFEGILF